MKLIASLNKVLSIAKGKYIARIDADDISYKNRIEEQLEFMEKNPEIGISGCQFELFGDAIGSMNFATQDEKIKLDLLITSTFGHSSVIFRSSIFKKYNLFYPQGYIHAEDYKLWTIWSQYTKMSNLDKSLVKFRCHNESISVLNRSIQRDTRIKNDRIY